MKRTLIALFAAAAIAVPALAQQQDPNQNTNQNTDQKADKAGQNPDQNAGGGQDAAMSAGHHAMTPTRSQVRMLQLGLNKGGFDAGPVDGVIGPKTQQALQKFQQQHGLQANGQLDSKTVAALRSGAAQAMAQRGAAGGRTASSKRAHGMHHR